MAAPVLDLIIDGSDRSLSGLLGTVAGRLVPSSRAALPKLVRNDEMAVRIREVQPSLFADRAYEDVELAGASVRVAIGAPDQWPTAGTFFLRTATEDTPGISAAAAAPVMEALLNSIDEIEDAGGVYVVRMPRAGYRVKWLQNGARDLLGANGADLSPLSVVVVSRIQTGTATTPEIQLIELKQIPYCFSNPATPFPVPAATVEQIVTGDATHASVQRVTIAPPLAGGKISFTANGRTALIGWDETAAKLNAQLGPQVAVAQPAASVWEFDWGTNVGEQPAVVVDLARAVAPKGVSGILALNVVGLYHAFAATAAAHLTLTLEVEVQMPGASAPRTILQVPVVISRDLIDLQTLRPATLLGIQSTFTAMLEGPGMTATNTITGLRGGAGALEAVTTATKALGYRYSFPLGVPGVDRALHEFELQAGAADAADPDYQIAPLDFDPATNNKHWHQVGGGPL